MVDFGKRIDELTLKLSNAEKKRVIKRWREYLKTLHKDGQAIMEERISWLKKSMKKKKKKKKEGKK